MTYNVLIPAAGKSTRFPGMRPKWMLTHPSGDPMIAAALKGLRFRPRTEVKVWYGVLKSDVKEYGIDQSLDNCIVRALNYIPEVQRIVLETPTSSQPETVSKMIEQGMIEGPIFIKDTDNYFACDLQVGNSVCTYDLENLTSVNPSNKSYVRTNDGMVDSIVEKEIISSQFCCGGYSFTSAEVFQQNYTSISNMADIYISDVISQMLLEGSCFDTILAENYEDWGTLEAWNEYKSKFRTYFIDIDGVILYNSGKYFHPKWRDAKPLEKNIQRINELLRDSKSTVILTTARDGGKQLTKQLEDAGLLSGYHLLAGLGHCKRVIVNDFANSNPFPSCEAINIKRDSDTLNEQI